MTPRKKDPGFNEILAELEEVVEQLESSDVSLEASLQAFEKGVALTRSAQKLLAEAEQKVQLLTGSGEDPEAEDFDDEDEQ